MLKWFVVANASMPPSDASNGVNGLFASPATTSEMIANGSLLNVSWFAGGRPLGGGAESGAFERTSSISIRASAV